MTAEDRIAGDFGKAMMTAHRQAEIIEQAQKQLLKSYELLAQCIRAEDAHQEAVKILEQDPQFAAWYRARYQTGMNAVAAAAGTAKPKKRAKAAG